MAQSQFCDSPFAELRKAARVSFNNKCSIKACVKRAQTCQWLVSDYQETVAIDYYMCINMTWSQGITVYLYQTMATIESQMRSSVEQSSDFYVHLY